MITRRFVFANLAVQYDGTNGQEIVDAVLPNIDWMGWTFELLSESAGEGTFRFDNTMGSPRTATIQAGSWLQLVPFGGISVVTDGEQNGNTSVVAFLPEDTP